MQTLSLYQQWFTIIIDTEFNDKMNRVSSHMFKNQPGNLVPKVHESTFGTVKWTETCPGLLNPQVHLNQFPGTPCCGVRSLLLSLLTRSHHFYTTTRTELDGWKSTSEDDLKVRLPPLCYIYITLFLLMLFLHKRMPSPRACKDGSLFCVSCLSSLTWIWFRVRYTPDLIFSPSLWHTFILQEQVNWVALKL